MRAIVFALAVSVLAEPAISASGQVYEGAAKVVDGDTIKIDGERLRLEGLDAPEKNQTCDTADGQVWACGDAARSALDEKIRSSRVRCVEQSRDYYRRPLVHCLVTGRDLGAWLVSNGWAVAYVRYSDRYVKEEAEARAARRGLWAGTFDMPWDWRARQRTSGK